MNQNCKKKELELELVSHECENYSLDSKRLWLRKTENYEIKELRSKKAGLNATITTMGI